MSLSTVAPKVRSNLRQYGHNASSYIDSTPVGWRVPGSVTGLLDVTRIALASTAAAAVSWDRTGPTATASIIAAAVTAARVSRCRRLVVATKRSLSLIRHRTGRCAPVPRCALAGARDAGDWVGMAGRWWLGG